MDNVQILASVPAGSLIVSSVSGAIVSTIRYASSTACHKYGDMLTIVHRGGHRGRALFTAEHAENAEVMLGGPHPKHLCALGGLCGDYFPRPTPAPASRYLVTLPKSREWTGPRG